MTIKKCISVWAAFLILVSNIGLSFNVHYCEGKIASISSVFNVEEVCEMKPVVSDKACCAEKSKSHEECCKDKLVDLKDDVKDIVIKNFSFHIDAPFLVQDWKPLVFNEIEVVKQSEKILYCCDANAPPLFKLYSQFIFYA